MSNSPREGEEVKSQEYLANELIQFCADGKLDIVRCYITPSDVNCVDNEGRTPLYAAACSGNVDLCKFLLSSNANADQQTGQDFYPIHGASSHGHENVLSLLLNHTTGINAQDSNGDTALHLACCRGNEECVNILLDAGAAVEIRNNLNKTPGMEAASNSHFSIMQVLMDFDKTKESSKRSLNISLSEGTPCMQDNLPPIISLPIFSPVETDPPSLEKHLESLHVKSPFETGPVIGSLPELLSPSVDFRTIRHPNRSSSELGYHEFSSLRSNSYSSRKFSDFVPPKNSTISRKDVILSNFSTDSALDLGNPLDGSKMSEYIIKCMLECFKPSSDSLLRFKLYLVKELIQRHAFHNNLAKEFFVILHTLRKDASPEVTEMIDKLYREFRIDNIFDLYTNYNVGNGMRVNIDFAIDVSKDCLFIRDPVINKIELISLDARGTKLGKFNIKIALLSSEHGQLYDPATERVNNENLLKYLRKYDPAYHILFHPYILQPSHIYCASTEDFLPYLANKDSLCFPIPASAFFIITPILEISLYQFLHSNSGNHTTDFDSSQELTILSLLSNCLLALEHLRQHSIAHRNITPQNIIVDIKHKRALLSDFSNYLELYNINGEPHRVKDINNKIPFYCSVSYAPELSHFSSLPQEQLSELELGLVYAHVDVYSVGRSFYQNLFLRETEPFPLQKYNESDPFSFQPSNATQDFLQRVLLSLISSSPQTRLTALSAAKLVLCLLSLEEYILREPTDLLLTSLLAAQLMDNRPLLPSSLCFYMLCGQEDVSLAQHYYFNK